MSAVGRSVRQYGLIVILIAFTCLALLYDFTVPVFEKPDELKHFAVIQFIQKWHRLPVVEAGGDQLWDQEGTQPPLYHILAAAVVSWLDLSNFEEPPRNPHYADERSFIWRERGNNNLYLHGLGEEWSLEPVFLAARLARWLSLLAGLGTISLTYVLALLVFADNTFSRPQEQIGESENERLTFQSLFPLLAAGFVAFIPQFLHVSSAITNDGLSATIAAAALVLLAWLIKDGSSTRYAVYLGVVLGLGAITKLSLLYLGPLTGVVLLFDLRRHRSWRRLVVFGAIVSGLMLLLAGWWYWGNWQRYGDLTALNAHLLYRGGPLDPRPTLAQIWQSELTGLELSFWAAFGAGQILLEPWLYTVLRWVKYIVFLGMVIGIWRGVKQVSSVKGQGSGVKGQVVGIKGQGSGRESQNRFDATYNLRFAILILLILWVLVIFIALLRWMQITPASWGRLLYPTLPAIGVLAVWGLAQFTYHAAAGTQASRITRHASRLTAYLSLVLPASLVISLFVLSLISPFRYLRAAYAKAPLISEADLSPEGIERLDLVYDDALRLIGYRVEKSPVRPGDWLPVTLYWQAVRPMAKNYSVFVHLLGDGNAVVGQINTYPGGGKWPTSFLEPGKILKDTYQVPVSPDAQAPTLLRLALGIFEFEDLLRTAKIAVNPTGEIVEPIVGAVPLLPQQWPKLDPAKPREANFAGQIRLVGYDWPAANPEPKPGDTIPLTFYWEALDSPDQNLNLFIHLVNNTRTQVAGFDGPPSFPTGFWQAGYKIIDSRHLSLPPDLPAGDYQLVIGWYHLDTLARLSLVAGGSEDTLTLLTISVTDLEE